MVQDMFQVAVSGWTLKPSVLQDWNVSTQYQRKMVRHRHKLEERHWGSENDGESALHEEPQTREFKCTARGTQVKESICGVLKPSIPVGCLKSNVGYCRGEKTAFAAVTLLAFLCS